MKPLTVRECEVLAAVAGGRTYRQVADMLGMSTATVKKHVVNANRKLGTPSAALAALEAVRSGHLPAQVERVLPAAPNPHPAGSSQRCSHCAHRLTQETT